MRVLVFSALSLLLAGCFTNGPSGTHSTSTSGAATMSSSTGSTTGLQATTDIIRFAMAPNLTTVAPHQIKALRVPVFSPLAAGSALSLKPSTWNFTWPKDRTTAIVWNLTLWVDVEGTVLGQTTVPPNANGTYRFWNVVIVMGEPGAQPRDDSKSRGGGIDFWEPQTVPNGVRELRASITLPAAAFAKGWFVSVSLQTAATFIAPGATVDLLTASTEYDSRMQVSDLQLPLEIQRLALLETS